MKANDKAYQDSMICSMYHSNDPDQKKQAIELAVASHQNHIYFIMARYFHTYENQYKEDLYQNGVIGLIKSLERYDASYALTTYSKTYIIHEMKEFVFFLHNIPSPYYVRIQRIIKEAETELVNSGYKLTNQNISEYTGIPLKIVTRERSLMYQEENTSIEDKEVEFIQSNHDVETQIINSIIAEQVKKNIDKLPPNQKEILVRKIILEHSYKEIASDINMEITDVYNEYRKGILKLRNILKQRT